MCHPRPGLLDFFSAGCGTSIEPNALVEVRRDYQHRVIGRLACTEGVRVTNGYLRRVVWSTSTGFPGGIDSSWALRDLSVRHGTAARQPQAKTTAADASVDRPSLDSTAHG